MIQRIPPRWRPLVWIGAFLAFFVVLASGRVLYEAGAAFEAAQEFEADGDVEAAVFHYRSAARWYFPGNPTNGEALDKLLALGAAAEEREDWVEALHIYDCVRAATLGARSFYTPHADKLATANERLPAVMARAREIHPVGPNSTPADRPRLEAEYTEVLKIDHAPPVGWSLVATFGFGVWIAGMFLAIAYGIRPDGTLVRPVLRRWGTVSFVGIVAMLGGLAAMI